MLPSVVCLCGDADGRLSHGGTGEIVFEAGAPAEPPRLSLSKSGAGLQLSWTGSGSLEEASQVTGPWTKSNAQTNPQTLSPTATARFYRVH